MHGIDDQKREKKREAKPCMTHEGDSNMISNVLKKTAFLPSTLELFFGGVVTSIGICTYNTCHPKKKALSALFSVTTFWGKVTSPMGCFGQGMVWAGTLNLLTEALQASQQPTFPADHLPPAKDSVGFRSPSFGRDFSFKKHIKTPWKMQE